MKRVLAPACALACALASPPSLSAEAADAGPKRALLPVILNILPGLGIGSFAQGDSLGGFIGLGGETAGLSLAFFGLVYSYVGIIGAIFSGMSGEGGDASVERLRVGEDCMIGGGILWAGTKVFEIVRPITFARNFNRERGFARVTLSPRPAPGLSIMLSY